MSNQPEVTVRFNLFDLLRKLEQQQGRSVSNTYVAEKSGLSRFTIQKIVNNDAARVDLATLAALWAFFRDEGMPIDVGDLFTVTIS